MTLAIEQRRIIFRAPDHDTSILETGRDSAYHVIASKGATYDGVRMALARIAAAVLRDENSILTVSLRADGHYGLSGICLSLPAIVNRTGVERVIDTPLSHREQELLHHSAAVLTDTIAQITL